MLGGPVGEASQVNAQTGVRVVHGCGGGTVGARKTWPAYTSGVGAGALVATEGTVEQVGAVTVGACLTQTLVLASFGGCVKDVA